MACPMRFILVGLSLIIAFIFIIYPKNDASTNLNDDENKRNKVNGGKNISLMLNINLIR